jgi:hypothetical protein
MTEKVTLVERLLLRLRELVRDISDLLEIRLQLLQLDLLDRATELCGRLVGILLIFLLLFGGVGLLLLALSWWLGTLLGSPMWGFGVIGLGLCLVAWGVYRFALPGIERAVRRALLRIVFSQSDAPKENHGSHRGAAGPPSGP